MRKPPITLTATREDSPSHDTDHRPLEPTELILPSGEHIPLTSAPVITDQRQRVVDDTHVRKLLHNDPLMFMLWNAGVVTIDDIRKYYCIW